MLAKVKNSRWMSALLPGSLLLVLAIVPATADPVGDQIVAQVTWLNPPTGSQSTLIDDETAVVDITPGAYEYSTNIPGLGGSEFRIDFTAGDRFTVIFDPADLALWPIHLLVELRDIDSPQQIVNVSRSSGPAGFLDDIQFTGTSITLESTAASLFGATFVAEFEVVYAGTSTGASAHVIRDNRSVNSIGIAAGDRIMIEETAGSGTGASVCTATQGALSLRMLHRGLQTTPTLYSRSIAYDFALAGDWFVECVTGSASSGGTIPGVGDTPLMPLVENVHTVGRIDTTPEFRWHIPDSGIFHSKVHIGIWDRDDFVAGGQANKLHEEELPPSTESYVVPPGLALQKHHKYTISIELVDFRAPGNPIARSRYFFDFSPVTDTPFAGQPEMNATNYEGTLDDVQFLDSTTARLVEGDSFTQLVSRPGVIVPAAGKFLEVDYEWINDGDFDDAGIILDVSGGGLPSEAIFLFRTTPGPSAPEPSSSGRVSFDLTPFVGRDVSIRFQIARALAQTGPGSTLTVSSLELTADAHDPDGDAIPSSWEQYGYSSDGEFVNLPTLGADPFRKTVFVYVDYMQNTEFDHRPSDLSNVVMAFANAPVLNADGSTGIDLRVFVSPDPAVYRDVDGPTDLFVPEIGALNSAGAYKWDDEGAPNGATYFDDIKLGNASRGIRAHFPVELAKACRYCIFAHIIGGFSTKYSGYSRGEEDGKPASDFLVTLGKKLEDDSRMSPPAAWQQGTFMHELGHVLGLQHGGGDTTSYKPNYLSVMNYSFQLEGLDKDGSNIFDYSRIHLPVLDENNLNEALGFGYWREAGEGYKTMSYLGLLASSGKWTEPYFAQAFNFPVNWNQNVDASEQPVYEANVAASINLDTKKEELHGFHDWARLDFRGGTVGAGAPLPGDLPSSTLTTELTLEEASMIPPAPVAGLAARAGRGSVRLGWNPRGPGGTITYRVYRKIKGATGDPAHVGTTTATAYSDRGLASGTTYEYTVTWINGFGVESAAQDPVSVRVR